MIEENKKKIEENGKDEELEKQIYNKESDLKLLYNQKKLNELLYNKLNNSFEEIIKVYNNDYVLSENDIKILLIYYFQFNFYLNI